MEDGTVINGWHVYVHPCFESQLIALTNEVESLRAKYPESYQRKATTKLLAAVFKVISSEICADPHHAKLRQGDTLGEQNKHWFRAKFLMQYRLFFRFSEQHKTIILAWMNDAETKRAYGSKRDAYKVFSGMLHNGYPPDDWALLLKQSQDWDNTNS